MKSTMCILALPILAVAAFAQAPTQTPQKTPEATPAAKTTQAQAPSGTPAEMKTQNYSGTLVAASCSGASTATAASTTEPATKEPATTKGSGDANRSAGSDSGCALSSSTQQFAIKTKDGQTVKLDDVGNQRTQEAIKNKKKWSEAASAGKPIHVTASGVMSGDQLVVMSIH